MTQLDFGENELCYITVFTNKTLFEDNSFIRILFEEDYIADSEIYIGYQQNNMTANDPFYE